MADVKFNPVLERVRGKIGNLVFRKKLDGEIIIARLPDTTNRVLTEAQKAHLERFREATTYGKAVLADAQARAAYELAAREKKQPIFSLMVADFFHVPKVDEIDLSEYTGQSGNTIGIRASDDFDVTGVTVTITTTAGAPVEHGAAVKSTVDPGRWTYTATTSVPAGTSLHVEAVATDRPGHTGTKVANA